MSVTLSADGAALDCKFRGEQMGAAYTEIALRDTTACVHSQPYFSFLLWHESSIEIYMSWSTSDRDRVLDWLESFQVVPL